MRITVLLVSALVSFSVVHAQRNQYIVPDDGRLEEVINSQWAFRYIQSEDADHGYESRAYNDSEWTAVSLPHTWNNYETTGEFYPDAEDDPVSDYPYWWIGWGWYRKHFSVGRDFDGSKIFLEFEGIQKYSRIWINGKYLGDHSGSYGCFDFDITDYVFPGEDNVLAVAVHNPQDDRFMVPSEYNRNFNLYGGIFRDVKIVFKGKLYIPMQGSATHEGGTWISVPEISNRRAVVRIRTWVRNDNQQSRECQLRTYIADASGSIVQQIKSKATIGPGRVLMFDQLSKPVRNPHMWSFNDPYRYIVYSEVVDGSDITDTYNSFFGFRRISYDDKDNNLILNGEKSLFDVRTFTHHHPWLGNAFSDWMTRADYSLITGDLDIRYLDRIHCPVSGLEYEMADRFGLFLILDSLATRDDLSAGEDTDQITKEVFRRARNHPSVLFTGTGEEEVPYHPGETGEKIITPEKQIPDVVTEGEPAKILLSGTQKMIEAERGSVVMLTADVLSGEGDKITGVDNALWWDITGPATLIGPSVYEIDTEINEVAPRIWYRGTPASNAVRSTGEPGEITVKVFASGLASGSFDIISEEKEKVNDIIHEPVLANERRKPVSRVILPVNRLEDVPEKIRIATDDFNMGIKEISSYAEEITGYIIRNNQSVDTTSVEFRMLVKLLARHLFNNGGHLTADDYNFNTGQFNNCRLIAEYINLTRLPPLFKDGLRRYYSEIVIMQGIERNAGEEMNWLNWIPSGGTVVMYSEEEGDETDSQEVIITDRKRLYDLITLVHPVFDSFSGEAKQRGLTFISKMNPYLDKQHVVNDDDENSVDGYSYYGQEDQPVLIPQLRFISE